MTARKPASHDSGDLLIIGRQLAGRILVRSEAETSAVYRSSGPQIFMRTPDGRWIWEGHCGHFSDGTPRPPWLDKEWKQRQMRGDPRFSDSRTYDIAELRHVMDALKRRAQ